MAAADAWVNWNPDPDFHLLGATRGRPGSERRLAMCGITVREQRGEFDPNHPKACKDCVEASTNGWTFDQYATIRGERFAARIASGDPSIIVCRRSSR